ncbi:MAG: 3-phosphoshikimate 1-carboxyvinyltransferase [Alphaproteobacteria bacterium]|nr:3-phosphoshikimate 1-carboxyvinyltransferase [Alphaproteobacteria bacterium]
MMRAATAHLLKSSPVTRLEGRARLPGDKAISHRALMLGAVAVGETTIRGTREGPDMVATATALRQLGATLDHLGGGEWRIHGVGVGGFREPDDIVHLGDSGTSARMLAGLVASHDFTSFVTGGPYLQRRSMLRVIEPLSRMGARFIARSGGRLPLAITGPQTALPIEHRMSARSSQVKSAILMAALNTPGETTVIEPEPTRDHTELLMEGFGATLRRQRLDGGALAITVVGQPELKGRALVVPGDPSIGAFAVIAAALAKDSDVTIMNVGVNPLRTGLFETLREMGADLTFTNRRTMGGEPVADIRVKGGALRCVDVPASRAPTMIDEYPALAIAAACATGTSRMAGLADLREDGDKLALIAAGLAVNGVKAELGADYLHVHGMGAAVPGGGMVETGSDYYVAMAFLVLGMAARAPVTIDDAKAIDTSFPGFITMMNGLGARIGDV